MTASLTPVAPQLAKLIRLLSTPIDGEALATVRAIDRVLTGAGSSWHALAEAMCRGCDPILRAERSMPSPAPRQKIDRPPTYRELEIGEQVRWLTIVRDADWTPVDERERAADLLTKVLLLHERFVAINRQDASRFNQLLRRAWANGVRADLRGRS